MHPEIPKDAREVYCDEKGEPIAFCPKDSIGIGDLKRGEFWLLNKERLLQLHQRAKQKTEETGELQAVICIDVDDPTWTSLAEMLMPGHDWNAYRGRYERPVARGVVPNSLIVDIVNECYPAAKDELGDSDNIAIFASGGISVIRPE